MVNKQIQQGKFYHIQYVDTGKSDYLESNKNLVNGRIYILGNGRQVRVIKRAHFKYTFEDIDNIRVMMEDYDKGTVQYNLCMRMAKAFNGKVPSVRFSDEEREILGYVYWENQYISDSDRETLKKALNIK